VIQRFPEARAAWLGGSVAAGQQTTRDSSEADHVCGV
jgi:hypothetical protein